MNDLPLLVLEELFLLLDVRSAVALASTTRRLHQASLRERLWNEFGARDFLLDGASRGEYAAEFAMFGEWIDIFARMAAAIRTIVRAVPAAAPVDIVAARRANVREMKRLTANRRSEKSRVWRDANRQVRLWWLLVPDVPNLVPPLLGSFSLYQSHLDHHAATITMGMSRRINGISLLSNALGVANSSGVVLQPVSGALRENELTPFVHVADSVLDYAERFAAQIESGALRLVDGTHLSVVPVHGESVRVMITDGIKITASPFVSPTTSHWPDIQTAYEITIEGLPNVRRCQLSTRHWDITDGSGHVDVVDGPGVVGNFPVVEPGSSFSYRSCCNMEIDLLPGTMGGYFDFDVLLPGEKRAREGAESIRATVPTFPLIKPRIVFLNSAELNE